MQKPPMKTLFLLLCCMGVFLYFAYYVLTSLTQETASQPEEIVIYKVPPYEPHTVLEETQVVQALAEEKPLVIEKNSVLDEVPLMMLAQEKVTTSEKPKEIIPENPFPARKSIRGIYVPYGMFNSPAGRARITDILDTTRINAVVIDVKDSTGKIYIPMSSPDHQFALYPYSPAAFAYLESLKARGVYVIARVVVFQDPLLSSHMPEYALKNKNGEVWKDFKGLSFLDPQNQSVWKYIEEISIATYALGFDEINFDYIRFPSDGLISQLAYNIPVGSTKADTMEDFLEFLAYELKKKRNIPISADIFGDAVRIKGDPGIGQVFEKFLPYFDAVGPMAYPSHYSSGSYGVLNPDSHPKEIMEGVASDTYRRFYAWCDTLSPEQKQQRLCDYSKNSPWIQDFSLKSIYGVSEVKGQIDALEHMGITSWFVWNASGRYTVDALK